MLLSQKVVWPESQLTRANIRKAVLSANVTVKYFLPQVLYEIHGNLSVLIPKLFIFAWFGFLRLCLNKGCKSKGKSSYVLSGQL